MDRNDKPQRSNSNSNSEYSTTSFSTRISTQHHDADSYCRRNDAEGSSAAWVWSASPAKSRPEKNRRRFMASYGSAPLVYAQMWEDLQMTEIPEAHDHRGAQVWDGSKAQQFLRQDMADGKYDDGMKPKDLYSTRNEYQVFPSKFSESILNKKGVVPSTATIARSGQTKKSRRSGDNKWKYSNCLSISLNFVVSKFLMLLKPLFLRT